MSWQGPRLSILRTFVAITVLFTAGAALAADINQLTTIDPLTLAPKVVQTATNLLGQPVAVAACVDLTNVTHVYVLTHRGWIYSLSPASLSSTPLASAKMPGADTSNNSVDYPAVALAVNPTTCDVYAGRNNGRILHYNSSLALQSPQSTVTGTLVGLTVDGNGKVYAATAAGNIFRWDSNLGSQATGTVGAGAIKAIKAVTTTVGAVTTVDLYVLAFNGTTQTTGYRLDPASLMVVPTSVGVLPGTPVSIASSSGTVIVATSAGLYNINKNIGSTFSKNLAGLVGVDMDSSSRVVALDSAGTVYVLNTTFSSSKQSGTSSTTIPPPNPVSPIAVTADSTYVVGGSAGASEGDPHLTTIDGVRYDFQSAGEFVLLRHPRDSNGQMSDAKGGTAGYRRDPVEIQVRQYPVATTANTCVSLNSAIAARVGRHRVTYEPNLSGQPDPSGLQLRIDGKIITLDSSGMRLGDGGRIVPTSRGIEVDFPDDTVLYVTPGWWASQGKWYLNVNVVPQQRAGGLIGDVPEGSWLPALPDGTSMGAKPPSAHDQYIELYERFAKAWRVTDKTSLFDYAPGTSTDTFTIRSWPPETGACAIPGTVPVEGAPEEVAREACKAVPGDPANCIFDVRVTGLANIASTYMASRSVQPAPETQPKPRCAGGGTVALLAFLGLLVLWVLWSMRRSKWTGLR